MATHEEKAECQIVHGFATYVKDLGIDPYSNLRVLNRKENEF